MAPELKGIKVEVESRIWVGPGLDSSRHVTFMSTGDMTIASTYGSILATLYFSCMGTTKHHNKTEVSLTPSIVKAFIAEAGSSRSVTLANPSQWVHYYRITTFVPT